MKAPVDRILFTFVGVACAVSCIGEQALSSVDDVAAQRPPGREEAVHQKCSQRLLTLLDSFAPDEILKAWIFFSDRGDGEARECGSVKPVGPVSKRAERRMMLRASRDRRAFTILPVCDGYIDRVRPYIARLRRISRYFNAVSCEVRAGDIHAICNLPFVKRLEAVGTFRRDGGTTASRRDVLYLHQFDDPLYARYGESIDQLKQIQVTDLHKRGYNGSGTLHGDPPVLICIMDSGFRRDHEALGSVSVVAEWDFINNDSITADEAGDPPGQDMHGTRVLGVIAGYHEGDLIGAAWGAEYVLAKTELYYEEIEVEEDNWVAGIEWADSIGADIVTSSLGYIKWYSPEMLDGDTPLCTRAADIAVSRGIIVVNSVGNRGMEGAGSLLAPADGDSVIAVGAVDELGEIIYFSSRGPTADGRIKPDLVAMGYGVLSVGYPSTSDYERASGTSFSAPLVAGLCALLLEAHPHLTPMEIRNALIQTATRSGSPDNTYGYGIPRGLLAAWFDSSTYFITNGFPNPFNEKTSFYLFFTSEETVTVRVYDCTGRLIKTLASRLPVRRGWTIAWDATNDAGRRVGGGIYFLVFDSVRLRTTAKVIYTP